MRVLDPLAVSPRTPEWFQRHIRGQKIFSLERRGKYLLFGLESGTALVIHLRMTGVLTYVDDRDARIQRRHLRLVFNMDNGARIAFHDQRRFGRAFILKPEEQGALWRRLGPEPLERAFNIRVMTKILKGRKQPVKSLLLDQRAIAGIGNIYADEALFAARIHPLRPSGSISEDEATRLVHAIKDTLRRAIVREGSSIDTYRTVSGGRGSFQETFRVHRRSGEPCPCCGGTVSKIKVGGRGTYFCGACQR